MSGLLNQQLGRGPHQSRSGIEQEPGPRGSPQLPQAPGAVGIVDEDPFA